MKTILKELHRYNSIRKKQEKIPRPIYLYLERYGRGLEKDLQTITEMYGEKKFFCYKTITQKANQTILDGFIVEQDKVSEFGSTWKGVAFIHFTGEEEETQITQLLDYLQNKAEYITPVFIIGNLEKVPMIKDMIQKTFFVREVQAECYEVDEILQMIKEESEIYGYKIERKALQKLQEQFEQMQWQEDEMVQNKICGWIDNLIFDKSMEESEKKKNQITLKDIQENPYSETPKKVTFGFVLE